MILIHAPGPLLTPKDAGDSPHGETEAILADERDDRDDAQIGVDGVKVRVMVDRLVGLDDGHAGKEEEEGEQVERSVGAGAEAFGLRGPGRLDDEDGEGEGEDAKGLEEGVRGDERDERVEEDACPDDGDEEDGAGERDETCPCWFC